MNPPRHGWELLGPMTEAGSGGGNGDGPGGHGSARDPRGPLGEADSTVAQALVAPLERIELPAAAKLGGVFPRGRNGRRYRPVMRPDLGASYHIMSRTAGGERLFGDMEKEALRCLMWRLARFSGLEIRTYAVMGNHFHILVRVPSHDQFVLQFTGEGGQERLFEHLRLLYSRKYIAELRAELADLRKREMPSEAADLLAGYLRRFCNLPLFVKELKERFSRWFNRHRGRRGNLWMERFKSMLVGDGEALLTMATYIDLNVVRAGIVRDPKDYRWCGYGEAMGGGQAARLGLSHVVGHGERGELAWDVPAEANGMSAAEVYRCWLFEDGESRQSPAADGLNHSGGTPAQGQGAETASAKKKTESPRHQKGK